MEDEQIVSGLIPIGELQETLTEGPLEEIEKDKLAKARQAQENIQISTPKLTLSLQQKKDLKDAFNCFDADGSGYMSSKDLKVALRALGYEPKKSEIQDMLAKINLDKFTEKICFNDFVEIVNIKIDEKHTHDNIVKAFRYFDREGLGRISYENIAEIAKEIHQDLNHEEIMVNFHDLEKDFTKMDLFFNEGFQNLKAMLLGADMDNKGGIDIQEFIKILEKGNIN